MQVQIGKSTAMLSNDGRYRYMLQRQWESGDDAKLVLFVGLNPSTADGCTDDPTVRKCIGFSKRWGYGGFYIVNLFAFRTKSPKEMMATSVDPVGPNNDFYIDEFARRCDLVVAAWGVNGSHMGRDKVVAARLNNLQCLGRTKDGHPRHPLYVPYSQELVAFNR